MSCHGGGGSGRPPTQDEIILHGGGSRPGARKCKIKHGKAFGKLVRDDEKVKELREAFAAAAKNHHSKVKDLHKQFKDASDDDKAGLRDQLKNLRKDWFEGMKGNREEVRTRIKEIRDEGLGKVALDDSPESIAQEIMKYLSNPSKIFKDRERVIKKAKHSSWNDNYSNTLKKMGYRV